MNFKQAVCRRRPSVQAATITAEAQIRNEHAEPRTFTYEVAIADRDGKTVATFAGKPQTLAPGQTTTIVGTIRVKTPRTINWWAVGANARASGFSWFPIKAARKRWQRSS